MRQILRSSVGSITADGWMATIIPSHDCVLQDMKMCGTQDEGRPNHVAIDIGVDFPKLGDRFFSPGDRSLMRIAIRTGGRQLWSSTCKFAMYTLNVTVENGGIADNSSMGSLDKNNTHVEKSSLLRCTKSTLAVREITKSSSTFSTTNISSIIVWLLQLHDTIQMKSSYAWINYNHDNIAMRSHIMIYNFVRNFGTKFSSTYLAKGEKRLVFRLSFVNLQRAKDGTNILYSREDSDYI